MFRILFYCLVVFFSFGFDTGQCQTNPNIILILGDDVGYNIPGCDGGTGYSTPNLDSMAQKGMRFTRCYASPLCSPSRHELLTGKYNFRNYPDWGILHQDQKTIANIFSAAGYKTACYGKWQFDGGDQSIHTFGFDNYSIFKPYQDSVGGNMYKNPTLYQNGHFVDPSLTVGKYGEDIYTDSVLNYIDSNKSKPFFIYYPMLLSHKPFHPTPDDSAFNFPIGKEDTIFYPSMIKYMDKKIGLIINKVKSLGIDSNTVIIFLGDNGTPKHTFLIDGDEETGGGGKGSITDAGTHVPCIVYGAGRIPSGTVNNNLISFPDFLVTLSNLANIPIPAAYGPNDGISFASSLTGHPDTGRQWIFNYFDPHPGKSELKRWAQTSTYKLVAINGKMLFYNYINDSEEDYPIADSLLTPQEYIIKQQLLAVLNGYATQSPPVLIQPIAGSVTDSSAMLGATITAEGGFTTVIERGTIIKTGHITTPAKSPENNPLAEGSNAISSFTQTRSDLLPQKKYFFKGYATNNFGTGLSAESGFYTLSKSVIAPPSSFTANPDSASINLHWTNAVFPDSGASEAGYLLIYGIATPSLISLPDGIAPSAKIVNGKIITHLSAKLPLLPDTFATLSGLKAGTEYHFLLIPYTWDGSNTSTYNYFVEGALPLTVITDEADCIVPEISASVFDIKCNGNSTGAISIDTRGGSAPYTFSWSGPGAFSSSSDSIFNLYKGTYLLRVVAKGRCDVTKEFSISEPPALAISATADSIKCNGGTTLINVLASGGSGGYLYNFLDPTGATVSQAANSFAAKAGSYKISVKDTFSCSTSELLTIGEPLPLLLTANADAIRCHGDKTLLTATASGGVPNYLYSLSDGISIKGPQTVNKFAIRAGQYVLTTEDAHQCTTSLPIVINQPDSLNISATNSLIACNGGKSTIVVTASGGVGGFIYSWGQGTNTSNTQIGNSFELGAGKYNIVVKDSLNCSISKSLIIDEPSPLILTLFADSTSCPGDLIKISATAAGGDRNYRYMFSNETNSTGLQKDSVYYSANAGTYLISVQDSKNCQAVSSLKIVSCNRDEDHFNVRVFPNPAVTDFILKVHTGNQDKFEYYITDVYGRRLFENVGTPDKEIHFGKRLSSGIYAVTVLQGVTKEVVTVIKGR